MTKRITDIPRRSYEFNEIALALADAMQDIFARKAYPIPDWFEDTNRSVAFDAIDELIQRGIEIEDRK